MRIKKTVSKGVLAGCIALATTGVHADEPLSAIDWLSNVVEAPKVVAPPELPQAKNVDDIAQSATPITVVTTTLGAPSRDAVGLVSSAITGLPANFWGTSSSQDLAAILGGLRSDLPPPLAELTRRILLAELAAPLDSGEQEILFRARVDELLTLGALEQAKALLDRADPGTAPLFQRWFDVSLLTGEEAAACKRMLRQPDLSPTYIARIFCMARAGDWDGASVTLNTAKALGAMTPAEDALLARFLDPELFEGEAPLPRPQRVTPLAFRMHEAIGEPLSLLALPNAFAFAALSENGGWKPRISAAERLARSGAIPASKLLAIYSERQPAASGGVWDRAEAVQAFETALNARDPNAVAAQLPAAVRAMRRAGLEPALGQMFGEALLDIPLLEAVRADATRLAFLSRAYEQAANSDGLDANTPALWGAVAKGDDVAITKLIDEGGLDALENAIARAFVAGGPAEDLKPLIEQAKLGMATLQAIKLMESGASSDPSNLEDGLRTLRHLGFADISRRMALFTLITRPRS
ncbi:MAG: hypothetical protein ABJN34_15285 [Litoreibacter sp.]|uniref:hypothetical protein n=1 Tax=Litoreibacter sp. TaxID=1969459 RepID=UPI00329A3FB2